MPILILILINMEDIRQKRLRKGPILSLNERLKKNSRNKKFVTHIEESMVFKVLKK